MLQIVMALQSDRRPNARQLAEECDVSRRTIFRDLEVIEGAGLRVEYDSARQGYRLGDGQALRPGRLEEREILALTVAVNSATGLRELGIDDAARSGLSKLVGGLSEDPRRRVGALDDATRDDRPRPPLAAEHRAIVAKVLDAVSRGVRVRLAVREPGGDLDTTLFSPYRLSAGPDGWTLTGRSSVDRSVRQVSLARIESAELTEEPVNIPPRFRIHPLHRPGDDEVVSSANFGLR